MSIQEIKVLLQQYEANLVYPVLNATGITWRPTFYGGQDDAIPHNQVLTALTVQNFIDHGEQLAWSFDAAGNASVAFGQHTIPLPNIGCDPEIGLFDKTQRPDLYDVCSAGELE